MDAITKFFFNLRLDIPTQITTIFVDILISFILKHVTFSTHIHGHWLDLLITRLTSDGVSDHQGVIVDINMFITSYLNENFL